MSIESNIKAKFQNQINNFYDSLVKSLDKNIKNAVQNLILFGYTDLVTIFERSSMYYKDHCRMNLDLGIVNTSVDFNWDLECERLSIEEEFLRYICSQDLNDEEIENYWAAINNIFKQAEDELSKRFSKAAKYKVQGYYGEIKVTFLDRYITYLCDKYSREFNKDERGFFDKKYTKELSHILNFFIKHKIMPDDITIHESIDGGKDCDYIFEQDTWKQKHHDFLKIQVSDDELLLRKENELLNVMLIFKDKKLRDDLNQNLISLYKKKTKIFEQERLRGSKINSFYIECKIDWRAF
ncbi:hypothetical protein OAM91_03770 [Gammaproteobacteria bacterium]|nr:hypothetical protein [Gammaproteobacteria bacterium]